MVEAEADARSLSSAFEEPAMSKTKGRTAARTGPGRKTQPSSSGCAEGARAGDPSLAKKMDGRAKAAQDVGVNGTDRLSTAHDDLLRFAYGRRFATILADPPWRFANRTGKMAPEHKRLSRYGAANRKTGAAHGASLSLVSQRAPT